MSWIVKLGKKGKKIVKKIITPAEKHYVGYTRRIERVKTGERICAMTFDDGPMGLPASPDRFEGKTLTDVLLDTLAQYGAKGSFDVIGDTSENYPDEAGKLGSAAWGGVKFDHYPDIHCDDKGGAVHNDRRSAACSTRAIRSQTTATATSSSAKSRLSTARASTCLALTPRSRI